MASKTTPTIRIPATIVSDPRILAIARALEQAKKDDPDPIESSLSFDDLVTITIGGLIRVLAWAKEHDGAMVVLNGENLSGVISQVARIEGFGDALTEAGLYSATEGRLLFSL